MHTSMAPVTQKDNLCGCLFLCDPWGTRTLNTLIKSQLLCQIELMGLFFVPLIIYQIQTLVNGTVLKSG